MRSFILVILVACACALAGVAFAASSEGPSEAAGPSLEPDTPPQPQLTQRQLQGLIDKYRHRTWHWQRVMGRPVTLTLTRPPAQPKAKIRVWRQVAARTTYVAHHPPHQRAWACIHRYEGSWADDGAPYYGGLQMDLGFQRAYGRDLLARKGTANHWTPLEQMWVAERAYRAGRGFYAWPNTARYCGLI
jgi:hypothetical protein